MKSKVGCTFPGTEISSSLASILDVNFTVKEHYPSSFLMQHRICSIETNNGHLHKKTGTIHAEK